MHVITQDISKVLYDLDKLNWNRSSKGNCHIKVTAGMSGSSRALIGQSVPKCSGHGGGATLYRLIGMKFERRAAV